MYKIAQKVWEKYLEAKSIGISENKSVEILHNEWHEAVVNFLRGVE